MSRSSRGTATAEDVSEVVVVASRQREHRGVHQALKRRRDRSRLKLHVTDHPSTTGLSAHSKQYLNASCCRRWNGNVGGIARQRASNRERAGRDLSHCWRRQSAKGVRGIGVIRRPSDRCQNAIGKVDGKGSC